MIRITQLKMPIGYQMEDVYQKVAKVLRIDKKDITSLKIKRESIDARKKPDVFYLLSVDASINHEAEVFQAFQKKNKNNKDVSSIKEKEYILPEFGDIPLDKRPVICGSGPAGLFCAYILAVKGFRPIVLERGKDVERRLKDVEDFWQSGKLNPSSNVQFGEGGAGTFSDGKLNTQVKDKTGRIAKALSIFVEMGAKESICYEQKPHVGTDELIPIVKNMRQKIISLGGEFLFESQLIDLHIENNKLQTIECIDGLSIATDILVLAIGHSARDTYQTLYEKGLEMEAKSFAVGYRVQHLQKMISESQYGSVYSKLPPAPYKLTAKAQNGRGVYSFCMCPGGYVVNASSEEGRLCVNGMSYSNRASENANSAIIVAVSPKDYEGDGPLAGVAFQRIIEEKAYQTANGAIPVQLFVDYKNKKTTSALGSISPVCKGDYKLSNLRDILPNDLEEAFIEGMHDMDKKIHGFAADDVLLCGVEARTSSPVRIVRDEHGLSNIDGIYPCGEGAGYAGGITSAAADGIYIAEQIIQKYKLNYEG